jgi:hypothetical protein
MTTRFPGVSVCVSILFLSVPSGCTTRGTLEIPEGLTGLFAYGSLISQVTLEGTLEHPYERSSYEVHLNGYEREWWCDRHWRSGPNPLYAHILRGTDSVPVLGQAKLDLSPKEEGRIAEEEGICILQKEMLDRVTSARDSRGLAFREEFDRTTRPCEYEIVPWEEIVLENWPW